MLVWTISAAISHRGKRVSERSDLQAGDARKLTEAARDGLFDVSSGQADGGPAIRQYDPRGPELRAGASSAAVCPRSSAGVHHRQQLTSVTCAPQLEAVTRRDDCKRTALAWGR
jgi:hypothetical protein